MTTLNTLHLSTTKPLSFAIVVLVLVFASFIGALTLNKSLVPMVFEGQRITDAQYVSQANYQLGRAAATVALPFRPDTGMPEKRHSRFTLTFEQPKGENIGVVFHSITDSAYVSLNGVRIQEIGEMDIRENHLPPRNRHVPTLVKIPDELLQPHNTLLVEVRSAWRASLGNVTVTTEEASEPLVARYRFVRANFIWFGICFALPMSFFMLGVWFFHRPRIQYLWLGLVLGLWPWNTLHLILLEQPIHDMVYSLIPLASNLFYTTALTSFVLSYCGRHAAWVKRLWIVSGTLFLAVCVTQLLPVLQTNRPIVVSGYLWMTVMSLLSTWSITANAIEKRTLRTTLMAFSGLFVEVIALYDFASFVGVNEIEPISFSIQYGVIAVMLCYSAVMSYELSLALAKSDRYNQHLTAEVAQQTLKLTRQFENIAALEKQQALHDERARLIADMHDGTSGHLASIIAGLKTEKLQATEVISQLENCLNDLRLILDSLNVVATHDLASALGLLKERMSPLVQSTGIKLHWKTHTIEDGLRYSPRVLLNVFRIIQEAIVNVVKHAEANQLSIEAKQQGDTILVLIKDNGKGFDKTLNRKTSYGLNSMSQRAENINAKLNVVTSSAGTTVELHLPKQLH